MGSVISWADTSVKFCLLIFFLFGCRERKFVAFSRISSSCLHLKYEFHELRSCRSSNSGAFWPPFSSQFHWWFPEFSSFPLRMWCLLSLFIFCIIYYAYVYIYREYEFRKFEFCRIEVIKMQSMGVILTNGEWL